MPRLRRRRPLLRSWAQIQSGVPTSLFSFDSGRPRRAENPAHRLSFTVYSELERSWNALGSWEDERDYRALEAAAERLVDAAERLTRLDEIVLCHSGGRCELDEEGVRRQAKDAAGREGAWLLWLAGKRQPMLERLLEAGLDASRLAAEVSRRAELEAVAEEQRDAAAVQAPLFA